jgi:acetyl/propionyl-CoA carboxylase alpha subunit
MKRALHEFRIHGIQTTIPFCLFALNHKAFVEGRHSTGFVAQHFSSDSLRKQIGPDQMLHAAIAATVFIRMKEEMGYDAKSNMSENGQSKWKAQRIEGQR